MSDLGEESSVHGQSRDGISGESALGLIDQSSLFIAEHILDRINPRHKDLGELIHSRSRWSGGILAGFIVFWWLTVSRPSEDYSISTSIFFGPTFLTVTILVPGLIFIGSILSDLSRENGQLFPGMISGIMFVLAILYVFEPVFTGFFSEALTVNQGLWRSARLAVLGGTVFIAAKFLIDAILLGWVKRWVEANPGIDLAGRSDESTEPEAAPGFEAEA